MEVSKCQGIRRVADAALLGLPVDVSSLAPVLLHTAHALREDHDLIGELLGVTARVLPSDAQSMLTSHLICWKAGWCVCCVCC
jgi:hypothetical protein